MNFGKGIIIIVNKWDLVEKDNGTFNKYLKEIKLLEKSGGKSGDFVRGK